MENNFVSYGVGVAAELERANQVMAQPAPKFASVKTADGYRVMVSAVGLSSDSISVTLGADGMLRVKGSPKQQTEDDTAMLEWDGFNPEPFEYNIPCGMHLRLRKAKISKGVLIVTLKDVSDKRSDVSVPVEDADFAPTFVRPRDGRFDLHKHQGWSKPAAEIDEQPAVVAEPVPVAVEPAPAAVVEPAPVVAAEPVVEPVVVAEPVVVEAPSAGEAEELKKAGDAAIVDGTGGVEEDKPVAVVDAAVADKPTVEVTLPVEMPQVVAVEIVPVSNTETVDAAIELKDATVEVHDDAILLPISTPAGSSDVVAAILPEDKEQLETKGVDVVQVIEQAVSDLSKAPELPTVEIAAANDPAAVTDVPLTDPVAAVSVPVAEVVVPAAEATIEAIPTDPTTDVTVQLPEVVSQVMEVTVQPVADPAAPPVVVVADTSEKIAEDAVLVPIVTQAGSPDIVVAVQPEVKAELEAKGVDLATAVEAAVAEIKPEVSTIVDVEVPIPPVVVDAEVAEKPTVEVNVPAEIGQVVEVQIAPIANTESTDVAIELKDATFEVKDDAVLMSIETEQGKSDVVAAVQPEVKAELEAKGVDIQAVVAEAIATQDVAPPTPEAAVDAATEGVVADPVKVEITTDAGTPVTVEIPEVVTQVMEVKVDDAGTVTVTDSSATIDPAATLMPVITPEGQSDIVVAVTPETASVLEEKGVSAVEVVEKAAEAVATETATVVDVPAAPEVPAEVPAEVPVTEQPVSN